MAETFLNELLQTTNSVQSDDQDRDCVICLQETGTMNRDTGFIELQLRLPCSHIVGSGCITIWLKENNSCPLCRREFFPTQPRPYLDEAFRETVDLDLSWHDLETDVDDEYDGRNRDHEDDDAIEEGEGNDEEEAAQGETISEAPTDTVSRIQEITGLCNDYCNRLSLTDGHRINVLAQEVAEKSTPLAKFADCRPESIAAACIYTVCLYMNESVTSEDLVAIAAVDVAAIRDSTFKLDTTDCSMVCSISLSPCWRPIHG